MSCDWTEKISAMIDGELPQADTRMLERHLVGCSECQLARADFMNLRSQIAAYNTSIDRDVTDRLLTQIQGRGAQKTQPASSGPFSSFGPIPAFAAVVLLIVAGVVALVMYRSMTRAPENAPQRSDRLAGNDKHQSNENVASGVTSSERNTESINRGKTKPGSVKQKTRPRVNTPKPRSTPPELTSPYGTQIVASNSGSIDITSLNEVGPADTQTLTARHMEQSELLLRAFRNVRPEQSGLRSEVAYERQRAQKLVYQNILLRREADAAGDVQVSTLLDSLEPILLDIANLPNQPHDDDVRAIKDRVQRKNLVALLQVNSVALARAND